MYLVCTPDRVLEVFRIVENAVDALQDQCAFRQNASLESQRSHAHRMRGTHQSCPSGASTSSRLRGDQSFPVEQQGVTVLASPVGHDEFIRMKLMKKVTEHQTLLERIPLVSDVQSAWILLLFCAAITGCAQFGPI